MKTNTLALTRLHERSIKRMLERMLTSDATSNENEKRKTPCTRYYYFNHGKRESTRNNLLISTLLHSARVILCKLVLSSLSLLCHSLVNSLSIPLQFLGKFFFLFLYRACLRSVPARDRKKGSKWGQEGKNGSGNRAFGGNSGLLSLKLLLKDGKYRQKTQIICSNYCIFQKLYIILR